VFAARVLRDMNRLFDASVGYGTSRAAALEGRTVRGKTGTTNDFRDAWFAGWSGGLAAVVWMGNDDFSPTEEAVGGAGPARVFARFMAAAPDYPAALDALLSEVRPADPIASLLSGEALAESALTPPAPEPDPVEEAASEDAPDPIADLLGRIGQEG
jgi:penicillin-binding protein 1A